MRQSVARVGEHWRRSRSTGHWIRQDPRRGAGRRIQSWRAAKVGVLQTSNAHHLRKYVWLESKWKKMWPNLLWKGQVHPNRTLGRWLIIALNFRRWVITRRGRTRVVDWEQVHRRWGGRDWGSYFAHTGHTHPEHWQLGRRILWVERYPAGIEMNLTYCTFQMTRTTMIRCTWLRNWRRSTMTATNMESSSWRSMTVPPPRTIPSRL